MPGVFQFSQTAATNSGSDPTQNWAEGMAPSAVNDSARALLASVARYRDDISGAILTTGTAQNYIVASNQGFDTKANFDKQMIAFTPHATNTGSPVTMTVDGFANVPVRSAPNSEILPGTLVQGTPYVATYNNADGALYLHGFFGNPYNIPLAAGMDYWAPTTPNSSFAFPIGQAISRTTYAALFALIGTTYGSGDGSTTFNLPDKRGRVSAALDPTGTVLNSVTIPAGGSVLGAIGGAQTETVAQANLPNVNFSVSGSASVESTATNVITGGITTFSNGTGASNRGIDFSTGAAQLASTGSISGTAASGGSGVPLVNVQPTIVCNYIMRVL